MESMILGLQIETNVNMTDRNEREMERETTFISPSEQGGITD